MQQCLQRSELGISSSGTVVRGGFEPLVARINPRFSARAVIALTSLAAAPDPTVYFVNFKIALICLMELFIKTIQEYVMHGLFLKRKQQQQKQGNQFEKDVIISSFQTVRQRNDVVSPDHTREQ